MPLTKLQDQYVGLGESNNFGQSPPLDYNILTFWNPNFLLVSNSHKQILIINLIALGTSMWFQSWNILKWSTNYIMGQANNQIISKDSIATN
jgi:hypothetical protein